MNVSNVLVMYVFSNQGLKQKNNIKASLAQRAEPLLCFGFPLKTHALKMEPLYATFCCIAANYQAILGYILRPLW